MQDESEIADRLKSNIPQDATYQPPTPAADPTGEPAFQTNISLGDPVIAMRLYDYFELPKTDKYSEVRQQQLKTVLEWASATSQSNDLTDVLTVLQRKEMEVGVSPFKDRLTVLYRLAKLEAQANFVNTEMRRLYGS